MRTAAILPVKRFAQAKQRLGSSLDAGARRALAGAMVADVLLALAQSESIEMTIVVTRERSIASALGEQRAVLLADVHEQGQSQAVALGVAHALAAGIERVLCIPGDCPALDPLELDALLASGESEREGAQVVIVPDRHGTGTNGLLLAPPDAIAPSFGPDSCERHRLLARDAGAACRLERPPSLLLDIDTGADLTALSERLDGVPSRASSTRTVLGELARDGVLSRSSSG